MEKELWVKSAVLPLFQQGKDLEVRICNNHTSSFRSGDVLIINGQLRRSLRDVRRYRDFEKMLAAEKPERIGPGHSADKILHALRSVYSKDSENQGVLVFELEP